MADNKVITFSSKLVKKSIYKSPFNIITIAMSNTQPLEMGGQRLFIQHKPVT